jgi:hypothetical protein
LGKKHLKGPARCASDFKRELRSKEALPKMKKGIREAEIGKWGSRRRCSEAGLRTVDQTVFDQIAMLY